MVLLPDRFQNIGNFGVIVECVEFIRYIMRLFIISHYYIMRLFLSTLHFRVLHDRSNPINKITGF